MTVYKWDWEEFSIATLQGKTLRSVEVSADKTEIVFTVDDGTQFVMCHDQDCCESVQIEEIVGELSDLIGTPILLAEAVSYDGEDPDGIVPSEGVEYRESWTWTFYKLATIKGYVTIRWYGTSNGYYSESVDFRKKPAENEGR